MSFTIQYTALILIILSFLIGTFVKPESDSFSKGDQVQASIEKVVEKDKLSLISLDKIFESGTANLNKDQLIGISQVLLQHDLQAELTIFSTSTNLILQRVEVLQNHFSDLGLPISAYKVKGVKEKTKKQLEVRVVRL